MEWTRFGGDFILRRRRTFGFVVTCIISLGILLLLLYLVISLLLNAERQARDVVEQFYVYENNGDYGRSWELLHEKMHIRFERSVYLQDRAHVFNGHFGADTFDFDIGDARKIKNWKMDKSGEAFGSAYEFEVKQDYHGKYGHFVFVQYVYVVREDGEWRIVWDYKK